MDVQTTEIEGVLLLRPRVFEDERGFFFESYNEQRFREHGINIAWVQDNHAMSRRDTLRGLHFQRGLRQHKLVRCCAGRIWDVAVDIRPGSPTLGRWFAAELSADNHAMLLIPGGCAHGYCVLSDRAESLYKCATPYDPDLEDQIAWNDPDFAVDWPVNKPVLSERDQRAQSFGDYMRDEPRDA